MTEDLAKGASDASEVNPPEGASGEKAGEPAEPTPEVKKLTEQLEAKEAQFKELQSIKDREMSELRQGLEARQHSYEATLDSVAKATLSAEEYASTPRPPDPAQEAIWRTGAVMAAGRNRPDPLPWDELEVLSKDTFIRDPQTLQSRLDQLATRLESKRSRELLEEANKKHLEEMKKLLQQKTEVETKAAEEVSQMRKVTGADAISPGGPSGQAPSAELRRRYEDDYKELLGSGGDRRTKLRAMNERYRQDGFDPDEEEWYKATL